MCVICVTFICLTWGLIDISMLEKCALAIQPYAELNVLSVCVFVSVSSTPHIQYVCAHGVLSVSACIVCIV